MNVSFFIQLTKKKKRKEKVPGEKATCEARGLGRGAAGLLGGELGASETPPKTLPEDERWLRRPERRCAPPRLSAEVPPSRGQVVSTRRDLGGAPGPRELYSKEKRRLTRFRPGQATPVRRLFGQRRAVWNSSHGDVILQKIEVCSEPAQGFLETKGKLPRLIGAEADVACSSGLLCPRCTLRSSHRVCDRLGSAEKQEMTPPLFRRNSLSQGPQGCGGKRPPGSPEPSFACRVSSRRSSGSRSRPS